MPMPQPDENRQAPRDRPVRGALHTLARAALFTAAVALLVGTFVTSCAGSRAYPRGPRAAPAPAAVEAFRSARQLLRDEQVAGRAADAEHEAAIRAALERAAAADPRWVAPRRLLDSRARSRLDGARALAERRARLKERDVVAADLYLAGRLEGAAGSRRFPMAIALDPSLAWPHHALSVDRELAGDLAAAANHQRAALERAYGGYELAYFARRYAALLLRLRQPDRARDVLRRVLDDPRPGPLDRHEVVLDLVEAELGFDASSAESEVGLRRAFASIASGATSPRETAVVIERIARAPNARPESALRLDLERALRQHPAFADDEVLLDAVRARGAFGATLALAERAELRAARAVEPWDALRDAFEEGDVARGVEVWLASLPGQALDAQGRPLDPRIAAAVARARSADIGDPRQRVALAESCFAAGWIEPATVLARGVPRDADAAVVADARALERRALAARALLDEIAQLLDASLGDEPMFRPLRPGAGAAGMEAEAEADEDGPRPTPRATAERASDPWGVEAPATVVPRDLDVEALLEEIAALVERRAPAIGWEDEDLAAQILASPVLRFGPFGAVLVPGPRFAERDAVLGLGAAGTPVPGLAQVFDRLGRVALFGQPPFAAIDGTVMRRLAAVERSGEHLGVSWNGMVLVCDGVEAASARGRGGLAISGAALHEGYWIDVQAERERQAGWRGWQEQLAQRGVAWAREVIAGFVLPLDLGAGGEARFERARLAPALGAAEVMRLALLVERAEAAGGVPEDGRDLVTLAELVEVVGNHEEGHLTDRARFLPLTRNLLGIVGIAAGELFRPLEIERRLEYRAQAIALATVPDPRLALDNLLEAAAVDARIPTVHAHAYRRLLAAVLAEWNARLEADPAAWPQVDRDAYLLHQLHRLAPQELRHIAVEVARREGLVARDF